MKCKKCGCDFEGKFCPYCGADSQAESNAINRESDATMDKDMAINDKVKEGDSEHKKSVVPIITVILGVVGLVSSCVIVGIVPGIIALILGVVSIISHKGRKSLAVTGIVTGSIALIIGTFMFTTVGSNDSSTSSSQEKYASSEVVEESGEELDLNMMKSENRITDEDVTDQDREDYKTTGSETKANTVDKGPVKVVKGKTTESIWGTYKSSDGKLLSIRQKEGTDLVNGWGCVYFAISTYPWVENFFWIDEDKHTIGNSYFKFVYKLENKKMTLSIEDEEGEDVFKKVSDDPQPEAILDISKTKTEDFVGIYKEDNGVEVIQIEKNTENSVNIYDVSDSESEHTIFCQKLNVGIEEIFANKSVSLTNSYTNETENIYFANLNSMCIEGDMYGWFKQSLELKDLSKAKLYGQEEAELEAQKKAEAEKTYPIPSDGIGDYKSKDGTLQVSVKNFNGFYILQVYKTDYIDKNGNIRPSLIIDNADMEVKDGNFVLNYENCNGTIYAYDDRLHISVTKIDESNGNTEFTLDEDVFNYNKYGG